MVRFWLGQLLRLVTLLIGVSVAAFALMAVSPIDPLQMSAGQAMGVMSAEQIARLEGYWGVNLPFWQRYLTWAADFLQGDWGVSLLYRRDVSAVLAERLGNSLYLMAAAWVISGFLGVALGVLAGVYQDRWLDKAISGYALVMAGTPAFWLALVLLMIFAVWLGVLPVGLSAPIGVESAAVSWSDRLRHGVLPVLTLSLTGLSAVILHTREKMIEVLKSDYVRFAQARGDGLWRIVRRHGLRNLLLPAITLQFAAIGEIFGGSVLVEQVFSYPGLGQAAVTAGLSGDVPLLLGITVVSAAIVFVGNLTANVLYGVLNPQIRAKGKGGIG